MNQYWYLCGETGCIKYAGKFTDFDECDEHLNSISAYVVSLLLRSYCSCCVIIVLVVLVLFLLY